jgi:hypothetical protein
VVLFTACTEEQINPRADEGIGLDPNGISNLGHGLDPDGVSQPEGLPLDDEGGGTDPGGKPGN